MRTQSFVSLCGAIIFLSAVAPVNAQELNDAQGLWLTENERAAIRLYHCEENKLCGKIEWIIAGGMQVDKKNPDEDKRANPLCGSMIAYDFVPDKKITNVWADGRIYKADEGDTYKSIIVVKDKNKLKVRGYVGIPLFGKSQIWTRVTEADYPACQS